MLKELKRTQKWKPRDFYSRFGFSRFFETAVVNTLHHCKKRV